VRGTIAPAPVRTARLEPLAQLPDARPATGPRPTAPADLFHRARAIVDVRIDVAVGGREAQADDHGVLKLIMLFKTDFVKGDPAGGGIAVPPAAGMNVHSDQAITKSHLMQTTYGRGRSS